MPVAACNLPTKATGLDTGVVYGRQLTGLILPAHKLVSVESARDYTKKKKIKVWVIREDRLLFDLRGAVAAFLRDSCKNLKSKSVQEVPSSVFQSKDARLGN